MKIDPATTAGRAMGRTTERKVRRAWAPRSEDASSSESGSRSSPAKIGRIMYGSHRYESTSQSAVSPNPGPCSPSGPSAQSRTPPVPTITRQAYALTR